MDVNPSVSAKLAAQFSQRFQMFLDKSVPLVFPRWISTLLLYILYFVRVFMLKGYEITAMTMTCFETSAFATLALIKRGWHIVTYALAIYHLNLFISFLSPKEDPSIYGDDADDDGPNLPTNNSQEFRPFIRRLPEFKFWYSGTKSILIAMFCTFFGIFNIPVFWPILVLYFIVLFAITMKRQIKHMIKYRYLPFTHGKMKYKGKEDTGKVFASS